ncbi:6-bladed beta-propeller [Litoribacter populi]|uniref:6-bladed beta-propeller n=1 Tax=Litoribacter populi TaxID=2598460 RepID=UPI00117CE822|nr:6-bladed beta-propeller [Litoribacter populi]
MPKDYLSLGLCLFFLLGCHSDQADNVLRFQIDLKNSDVKKFSDLFSSVQYTLLDVGDEHVLAQPSKMVIKNNHIFVEDRQQSHIFIFENSGLLKTVIKSNLNAGPGEYLQLEDFQAGKDQITIRDYPLNKTLYFDLNGNLLKEKKEELLYYYFHEEENWKLSYMGFSNGPDGMMFLREDNSQNKHYQFQFSNNYDWINVSSKNGFMANSSEKAYFFRIPYSYQVAKFNSDGFLSQTLEWEVRNGGMSDSERFRFATDRILREKIREGELVNEVDTFFPLSKYYFLHFNQGNPYGRYHNHYILYDKEFNKLFQGKNLENDLDGMPLHGVPWTFTEDEIILIINSTQFYNQYIETYKGKKVQLNAGNIHTFFQENKKRLPDEQQVMVSLKLKDF